MALVSQFLDARGIINAISQGTSDQMQINKHLRELMMLDQKYAQNADQGRLRKTALDAAFDGPKPANPVVSPTEYGGPLTPKSDLGPVPAGPVRDGSQYITGKGAGFPDIGPSPKELDRAPGYAEAPRTPVSGVSLSGAPTRLPDKSPFEASQTPPVKPIVPSVIANPNVKTSNSPAPVDPIAKGLAKLDANTQPAAPQNVDVAQRTMKAFVAKKEDEQYSVPNRLNNGLVDPTLVGIHKDLKDSLGLDLEVTSGFRNTETNIAAGGAKKSKHLDGIAMDLRASKLAPWERDSAIAKLIDNPNVGAVGVYPSGNVHVDLRKSPGNVKINGSDKTITSWGSDGSYNNSVSPIVARIAAMDPAQRRALYEGDQPSGGGQQPKVNLNEGDGYFARLSHIESGGNNNATNSVTGAAGPYQFTPATAKQYGLRNPYDPAEARVAAEKFTNDNRSYLTKTLGRQPTGGELYLAHQQGAGGASKLLANPNARAADVVGTRAVTLNGGRVGMTAGEFANMWISKFENGEVPNGGSRGGSPGGTSFNGAPVGGTNAPNQAGYGGGRSGGGGINAGSIDLQALINQAVAAALAGAQGAGQALGTPINQLPPLPQPTVRSDLRQPSPADRGGADFISQVPLTPQQAGSLIDLLQKLVGTGTPDSGVSQDVSIGSAL